MANNVITVQAGGFVNIEDFKDILDVEKVVFYEFTTKKDGSLILKFYDKKKKLVRPYAK